MALWEDKRNSRDRKATQNLSKFPARMSYNWHNAD